VIIVLTVTGNQTSKLLPVKVSQLKILINKSWIFIDRLTRRFTHDKAFLIKEDKRVIKGRKKDFQALLLMKKKGYLNIRSKFKPNAFAINSYYRW